MDFPPTPGPEWAGTVYGYFTPYVLAIVLIIIMQIAVKFYEVVEFKRADIDRCFHETVMAKVVDVYEQRDAAIAEVERLREILGTPPKRSDDPWRG